MTKLSKNMKLENHTAYEYEVPKRSMVQKIEKLTRREKKERRKRRNQINRLVSLTSLKKICSASIDSIMHGLGGVVYGKAGEQHAYKDNGSKILAVAHLDTVQQSTAFWTSKNNGCTVIHSPKLDDRLGVYTILDLLPKLGINVDILFCENEECGRSTGADFKTDKVYNWIVEFDRAGDDAVCYVYKIDNMLGEFFKVGIGSFTDICTLEHLKTKAFNVGVGYHNEHSLKALCVLETYISQMEKFIRFYSKHKDTRYEHTQRVWPVHHNVLHQWDYYEEQLKRGVQSGGSPRLVGISRTGRAWCSRCQCYKYTYDSFGGMVRCIHCSTVIDDDDDSLFERHGDNEYE